MSTSDSLSSLGWGLVTLAIAPGILAHEYAHVAACRLLGVPIHQHPRLNPFGRDAYLDHEVVESFPADLAIAVAPFLANVPLAVGAFALAVALPGSTLSLPFLWLGGCFALTALPSTSDTDRLLTTAETLPRVARPFGYLVAGPIHGFTRLPGAAGIVGALLAIGLYDVAADAVGTA